MQVVNNFIQVIKSSIDTDCNVHVFISYFSCITLPVVHNYVLLYGFQCLTIDTKSKAGNSQSSDSFVNILK